MKCWYKKLQSKAAKLPLLVRLLPTLTLTLTLSHQIRKWKPQRSSTCVLSSSHCVKSEVGATWWIDRFGCWEEAHM